MTGDQRQPGYRGSLQPNCVTIAQVLKSAGYKTAMTGKWHVGDNVSPIARGFDDFYGWTRGYGVNSWDPRMMIRLPAGRPQRAYQPGEFFATDALTDHALDFLADNAQGRLALAALRRLSGPALSLALQGLDDIQPYAEGLRRRLGRNPQPAPGPAKTNGPRVRRHNADAAQPDSATPWQHRASARPQPTATIQPGIRCPPIAAPTSPSAWPSMPAWSPAWTATSAA